MEDNMSSVYTQRMVSRVMFDHIIVSGSERAVMFNCGPC